MRSSSFSKSFLIGVAAVALASACARSAPDLPPQASAASVVLSPVEARFSCDQIDGAITALQAERDQLTSVIQGNRQRNQTAGYLGALFIVPLVATESNDAEKKRLDEIQAETDRLYAVRRARSC